MSITSDIPGGSPIVRWLLLTGIGYTVLLSVSLWFPIGLHRIVMCRRDWWNWSVSYLALAAGVMVWLATGRQPIAVVALLGGGAWWFSLLVKDLLTMWAWHWPFERTIADQLAALDKRFNLLGNIGLFVVVALAMLWLARAA